jgi:hypothetical protein
MPSSHAFLQYDDVDHSMRQGVRFRCQLEQTRCAAKNKRNGRRCARVTFRHPLCLQHTRSILGVDVRRSTIPNAGCGLFAVRTVNVGDAVTPYGGHHYQTEADYPQAATRPAALPYTVEMGGNHGFLDAACLRGLGSYANHAPTHGRAGRRANVRYALATLSNEDVQAPPAADPAYGIGVPGRPWRRLPVGVPAAFLQPARRHVWLVATHRIQPDEEIFADYGALARDLDLPHKTTPRPCR